MSRAASQSRTFSDAVRQPQTKPLTFIFHIFLRKSLLMTVVFLGICQTDLLRRGALLTACGGAH